MQTSRLIQFLKLLGALLRKQPLISDRKNRLERCWIVPTSVSRGRSPRPHAEGAEIIGHAGSVQRAEHISFAYLTCRFCFYCCCRWHCIRSRFCCVEREGVGVSPFPYHSADRLADTDDLNNEKER